MLTLAARADSIGWPILMRNQGVKLPTEIARRMRRFHWTTDLRYEMGRKDTGETVAFLKTVRVICDWVEGQLP